MNKRESLILGAIAGAVVLLLLRRGSECCCAAPGSRQNDDSAGRPYGILDTPHAGLIDVMGDPVNQVAGPFPAAIPYDGFNSIAKPPRAGKIPLISERSLMPDLIRPSTFDPGAGPVYNPSVGMFFSGYGK